MVSGSASEDSVAWIALLDQAVLALNHTGAFQGWVQWSESFPGSSLFSDPRRLIVCLFASDVTGYPSPAAFLTSLSHAATNWYLAGFDLHLDELNDFRERYSENLLDTYIVLVDQIAELPLVYFDDVCVSALGDSQRERLAVDILARRTPFRVVSTGAASRNTAPRISPPPLMRGRARTMLVESESAAISHTDTPQAAELLGTDFVEEPTRVRRGTAAGLGVGSPASGAPEELQRVQPAVALRTSRSSTVFITEQDTDSSISHPSPHAAPAPAVDSRTGVLHGVATTQRLHAIAVDSISSPPAPAAAAPVVPASARRRTQFADDPSPGSSASPPPNQGGSRTPQVAQQPSAPARPRPVADSPQYSAAPTPVVSPSQRVRVAPSQVAAAQNDAFSRSERTGATHSHEPLPPAAHVYQAASPATSDTNGRNPGLPATSPPVDSANDWNHSRAVPWDPVQPARPEPTPDPMYAYPQGALGGSQPQPGVAPGWVGLPDLPFTLVDSEPVEDSVPNIRAGRRLSLALDVLFWSMLFSSVVQVSLSQWLIHRVPSRPRPDTSDIIATLLAGPGHFTIPPIDPGPVAEVPAEETEPDEEVPDELEEEEAAETEDEEAAEPEPQRMAEADQQRPQPSAREYQQNQTRSLMTNGGGPPSAPPPPPPPPGGGLIPTGRPGGPGMITVATTVPVELPGSSPTREESVQITVRQRTPAPSGTGTDVPDSPGGRGRAPTEVETAEQGQNPSARGGGGAAESYNCDTLLANVRVRCRTSDAPHCEESARASLRCTVAEGLCANGTTVQQYVQRGCGT